MTANAAVQSPAAPAVVAGVGVLITASILALLPTDPVSRGCYIGALLSAITIVVVRASGADIFDPGYLFVFAFGVLYIVRPLVELHSGTLVRGQLGYDVAPGLAEA